MTVWDGLSLCFVLLLALYGCAQAMVRIVSRILRPKKPRVTLVLTVGSQEDLEQQIRYAQWISCECRIPLRTDTEDIDDETRRIVAALLDEKI